VCSSDLGTAISAGLPTLPFGKGELRRTGKGVAILAFGTLLYPALQAANALNTTVVNMRWAKPLDTELLLQVAASHDALVTVEEGALMGVRVRRCWRLCKMPASLCRCCDSVFPMCSLTMATRTKSCLCWV